MALSIFAPGQMVRTKPASVSSASSMTLEAVLEAALELHELLDRQFFLRHVVQMPFAVDDLVQRPDAGLDCHFADLGEHLGRILPAARTRRHDVDERRTSASSRSPARWSAVTTWYISAMTTRRT